MRIDEYLQATRAQELSAIAYQPKKEEDEASGAPSSWGADTVSISAEAVAARKIAEAAEPQDAGREEEERSDTAKAFADYMDKASGKSGGGASGKDQLKALQEKLESLQSSLQSVASDAKLPEEAKAAQMGALNAEINAVMAQIAELSQQEAESA